jgi:molecular chaperone DnaK (HSP70)
MKLGIDFGTCYSSAALLIDGVLRLGDKNHCHNLKILIKVFGEK